MFLCFYLITQQDNWITPAALSQRAIFNQISTSSPSNACYWHESEYVVLLGAIISCRAQPHSTVMIIIMACLREIRYSWGHRSCQYRQLNKIQEAVEDLCRVTYKTRLVHFLKKMKVLLACDFINFVRFSFEKTRNDLVIDVYKNIKL